MTPKILKIAKKRERMINRLFDKYIIPKERQLRLKYERLMKMKNRKVFRKEIKAAHNAWYDFKESRFDCLKKIQKIKGEYWWVIFEKFNFKERY